MARKRASRRTARRSKRTRNHSQQSGSSLGRSLYHRQLRLEPLEERRMLAVVTVTTLSDTVDFNDGQTSLREAIFAANTVPGADTIQFAPSLTAGGPAKILLTQGELKITGSLTILGLGADLLAIDASGNDSTPDQNNGDGSLVFDVDNSDADTLVDVTISGMTLTGGDSQYGGALLSYENLNLSQCTVTGNSSTMLGGGVCTIGGNLEMDHSTVSNNASGGYGGGLATTETAVTIADSTISGNTGKSGGGAYFYDGNVALTNCLIADNKALGTTGVGGGLDATGGALHVTDSRIAGNTARNGGGIYSQHYLQLDGSTVSGNLATNDGGGVLVRSKGKVTTSTIVDNRADRDGGGVWSEDTLSVNDSTIARNTAGRDGGGLWLEVVHLPASLVQVTVSDNTSSGNGGGIWAANLLNGTVTIAHSTVAFNQALATSLGGGVFVYQGAIGLDQTIVATNIATTGTDITGLFGASITARYSLIGDNANSGLADSPLSGPDGNGNLIGGPIRGTIDPKLQPLAYNGGPTPTHAIPGPRAPFNQLSPAVDAGDPAAAAGVNGVPQFDQRGASFARIVEGDNRNSARIDIGAFEAQRASFVITYGDYNRNGIVDAADYTVWKAALGTSVTAPYAGADGNGDGKVTWADYDVWRGNFGLRTSSFGAAAEINGNDDASLAASTQSLLENDALSGPIVVTTLADTVDFNDGVTSLREAIFAANLVPGPNTIEFASSLTTSGPATILLTQGELNISDALDIEGPGASLLTIDAQGNSRIFDLTFAGFKVAGPPPIGACTIAGLTLTGGRVSGPWDPFGGNTSGGAILSTGSSPLTLDACIVTANQVDSGVGEAIFSRGDLTLVDCTIGENTATLQFGAAAHSLGKISVTDSVIRNNQGGIYAQGDVSLVRSIVEANGANGSFGSGVFSLGNVTVEDSAIRNNTAGGIVAKGTASLRQSIVSGNTGGLSGSFEPSGPAGTPQLSRGAGIYAHGDVELIDSTVSGNSGAALGGGVSSGGSVSLSGSTLSGNRAMYGGGLFAAGDVTIVDCTIANNSADESGGGIFANRNVHQVVISGSIVAGNTIPLFGLRSDIYSATAPIEVTSSLIGDNSQTSLVESPPSLPDANGNLIGGPVNGAIDPLLGPLADSGGFTLPDGSHILTMALLPGSPAINAGDLNAVAGQNDVPQFDERGTPFGRVFGGRIDIGAFEHQASSDLNLLVDTLADESNGNYSRGDLSLREAIQLANEYPGADTIHFDPALTAGGPAKILLTGGELAITDALTIDGPAADLLTIDAQRQSRIFDITATAGDCMIDGLTLTGGSISDQGQPLTSMPTGGAIRSASGSRLTIGQCMISGNEILGTAIAGSAIYTKGDVKISDTTISGNVAPFAIGSSIFAVGDLALDHSIVRDNAGGGIATNGRATIVQSEINGNTGGFDPYLQSWRGYEFGAGIYARSGLALVDSLVSGNSGAELGGGIFSGGDTSITGSTVSGNSSLKGGGIYAAGKLTVKQSKITGNQAHNVGGGIYTEGNLTLLQSTVSGNVGVGIFTAFAVSEVTIDGSIVAGNTTLQPHQFIDGNSMIVSTTDWDLFYTAPPTISLTHSLIGVNHRTTLVEAPIGLPDAHGNLIGGPVHGKIDPLLGPLADNGGFTLPDGSHILTRALLPGSPAINAGDLNSVPRQNGVPQFDERGTPFGRVFGGRIDIGAFEYQAPSDLNLLVDTLVDESDGNYSRGDLSLREAIQLANENLGADTIHFDPALTTSGPARILLTQGELAISDPLTIDGPGARLLTIDASGNDLTPDVADGKGSRVFNVDDHNRPNLLSVSIGGLTLTGGDVNDFGGVIFAAEDLQLTDVVVERSNAFLNFLGSGAIYDTASLTMTACRVSNNRVSGGNYYNSAIVANGLIVRASQITGNIGAGGVFCGGDVLIEDSTISDNDGVGLQIKTNGSVKIIRSTISGNVDYGFIGGGLSFVGSGTVLISDSTFAGNTSVGDQGGGAYFDQFGEGSVTIERCAFIGNRATAGGGIRAHGNLTVVDSEFRDNMATGVTGNGGGLFVSGYAPINQSVVISGTNFNENSARGNGGAIYLTTKGSATITGNSISANTAFRNGGGLAINALGGEIVLRDAELHGNNAAMSGGGAWISNNGLSRTHIENVTLDFNVAGFDGGGAAIDASNVGLLQVTISGNSAGHFGGGISIGGNGSTSIAYSTIASNGFGVTSGGGIFANGAGVLKLTHSIVAGNNVRSSAPPDLSNSIHTFELEFSLIGNSSGSGLTPSPIGSADAYGNLIGGTTPTTTISPELGRLADNGGFALPDGSHILTQMLLAGSPAINAGDPAALAGVSDVPASDQRGAPFTRIFGRQIDIGAVEYEPTGFLAGDYNRDGIVDTADYLVWRLNLGHTIYDVPAGLPGDGNGDNIVNQADYDVWKGNFGATLLVGSSSSVESSAVEQLAKVKSDADARADHPSSPFSSLALPIRSAEWSQAIKRLAAKSSLESATRFDLLFEALPYKSASTIRARSRIAGEAKSDARANDSSSCDEETAIAKAFALLGSDK